IMTRTAFTEVADKTIRPGEVLSAINQRLQGLIEERFVTAFYGVINRRQNTLRYASAGHPYPYLIRPSQSAIRPLTASGFMLGIVPDEVYTEKEVALEPGDRICAYTDGLIECRNEIGEQFGTERLVNCLREMAAQPADQILSCVLDAQKSFINSVKLTDDVTVIVTSIGM
ncbi:MAG: PP2C family protein-serine/threonine phosphatase, partial [Gemmataceae bacterium]